MGRLSIGDVSNNSMIRKVYLDNSATTRMDEQVLAAMLPYWTEIYGNASSTHQWGQPARQAIEEARRTVAKAINAQPGEITFLSGGTEADNLAIKGVAEAYRGKGRHLITSRFEHSAVLATCAQLEAKGWHVTYLPVYREGIVRLEDVRAALTPETVLISIMHANNEIGTIQPIGEIGHLVRERREAGQTHLFLHTDAVQTLGVDLLACSGHKIHGPKGIGALYVRRGVRLESQMHGGHHERDRRAGTESVPLIVGLAKAVELAVEAIPERMEPIRQLRDQLEEQLMRQVSGSSRNGDPTRRVPHIANLNFDFVEGEGLQISLDLKGIAVSTGSACASGSTEPSHVLVAIGHDRETGRGSLRFSFGKENQKEDVEAVLETLPGIIEKLRQISPRARESQAVGGLGAAAQSLGVQAIGD